MILPLDTSADFKQIAHPCGSLFLLGESFKAASPTDDFDWMEAATQRSLPRSSTRRAPSKRSRAASREPSPTTDGGRADYATAEDDDYHTQEEDEDEPGHRGSRFRATPRASASGW